MSVKIWWRNVSNRTDLSTSKGPLVEDLGLVAVNKCQYVCSVSFPQCAMEGQLSKANMCIRHPNCRLLEHIPRVIDALFLLWPCSWGGVFRWSLIMSQLRLDLDIHDWSCQVYGASDMNTRWRYDNRINVGCSINSQCSRVATSCILRRSRWFNNEESNKKRSKLLWGSVIV